MIDASWSHRELSTIFGALSKPDQRDVPLPWSVIADNTEFYNIPGDESRGLTRKRYGFGSTGLATTLAHFAIYDWISSLGHLLVYWSGTGALAQIIGGSATTLNLTNSASGVNFAKGGARLFMALFTSTGQGERQGRVLGKDVGGTLRMDALFPAPITYTPSAPTEPGAGVVTAGLHRFGYIIEYRSGFFGRLQPDNGTGVPGVDDTFVPVEFTATGSKSLRWVLNTTWPTDATKVHVAMAAVANRNLFILVPGTGTAVTGGALESKTINFNIGDEDLLATKATGDVTQNRLLYTQVVAGTGPFNPSAVISYGDRMVYVTRVADSQGNLEAAAYASDRNKFQHITISRHKIQSAMSQDIITGFALNKELFLLSPYGTYSTRDNSLDPVQWPTLREVNGKRGCVSVNGFAVNPDAGYAWVASRAGIFLFNGSEYTPIAITDGVAEWDNIIWSRAQEIQLKEDPVNQRLYAAVPLNATVGDLTVLCFSYRRGKAPSDIDFSKWTLGASFKVGAIEMVVNDWASMPASASQRQELTLISGAAAARRVLRQKGVGDTNPKRDYQTDSTESAIVWNVRLAPFTDGRSAQLIRHEAVHLRMFGSGIVSMKAVALDGVRTYTLSDIALSAAPGAEVLRGIDKTEDGLMLDFTLDTLDSDVTLGGLRYYWQSGPLLR